MSPWLSIATLIINIALANISLAKAAPTSLGPTSAAEASILWKDGQTAFQTENFTDAISRLQRLVDRYPGYPDYQKSLEAYRLLGESYLLAGKPEKAIRPLRHFAATASAAIPAPVVAQGKFLLGKAYLATRRFHEAYLLSLEFEKREPEESLQRKQGLLLKSRSLMGLGKHASAEPLVAALEKSLEQSTEHALKGELFLTKIELKLEECRKLPSKGKMDEGQARLQLERRGVCLQEALLQYQKGLPETQTRYLTMAEPFLAFAFEKYHEACLNPPSPPALRPKDRTPTQLRKYRAELVEVLKVDCGKSMRSATDLLLKDARTRPLATSIEKILEKTPKGKHD